MYLLINCAACAAPLALDAPTHCVRCNTRYCSDRCRRYHAHRGGHDEICEEIHSGGGAEQYHADKKYKEAVAAAVEKCAADVSEGQTCYICMANGAGEGLVRMCACRGETGFAHVSCLVRLAESSLSDVDEDNFEELFKSRWDRWETCSICKQQYLGVVDCALGWACWKKYVDDRSGEDFMSHALQINALNRLGQGLRNAGADEDALRVFEALLAEVRRNDGFEVSERDLGIIIVQNSIACTYRSLGREEEAARLFRDVYSRSEQLFGAEDEWTLHTALNLGHLLLEVGDAEETAEGISLLRDTIPVAQRVFEAGNRDERLFTPRLYYAAWLYQDPGATLESNHEAVTILEDMKRIAHSAFGSSHPTAGRIRWQLRHARDALAARESPPPGGA